jgi:hypothetical protein
VKQGVGEENTLSIVKLGHNKARQNLPGFVFIYFFI